MNGKYTVFGLIARLAVVLFLVLYVVTRPAESKDDEQRAIAVAQLEVLLSANYMGQALLDIFKPLAPEVVVPVLCASLKQDSRLQIPKYRNMVYVVLAKKRAHQFSVGFEALIDGLSYRESAGTAAGALRNIRKDQRSQATEAIREQMFSDHIGDSGVRRIMAVTLMAYGDDASDAFISLVKWAEDGDLPPKDRLAAAQALPCVGGVIRAQEYASSQDSIVAAGVILGLATMGYSREGYLRESGNYSASTNHWDLVKTLVSAAMADSRVSVSKAGLEAAWPVFGDSLTVMVGNDVVANPQLMNALNKARQVHANSMWSQTLTVAEDAILNMAIEKNQAKE